MLSRVADSLYWMSRYLERAEHTARLVDVNLNVSLDQSPANAHQRWRRMLESIRATLSEESLSDSYRVAEALTFDSSNFASIVSCITVARENARQVRQQISSEMWEQLNTLYLQIKSGSMADIWSSQPHEFFRTVREGAHLFQGITDSTISHGEGWHFIQLGRFLERAVATASLLDIYFQQFFNGQIQAPEGSDYLEWVGLLKSCTAFEAYCKVYTADLHPERVAEFLLLNAEFPRSIHFSARMVQDALNAIAESTQTQKSRGVNRLAGRLRATLGFGQIDEIISGGLHNYLEYVQRQFEQVHAAIHETYIAYEIESELAH